MNEPSLSTPTTYDADVVDKEFSGVFRDEIYFYKKGDNYGWMSNFYPAGFEVCGEYYPTVEHYYQSRKAKKEYFSNWIASAPSAFLAFKAGRSLRTEDMKENWVNLRVGYMKVALLAKFGWNPYLKKWLLETDDALIHENSPTDKFWGVRGADMLGKLLEDVREHFESEEYDG